MSKQSIVLLKCGACGHNIDRIEKGVAICPACNSKTLITGIANPKDLYVGVTHEIPLSIALGHFLRKQGYKVQNCCRLDNHSPHLFYNKPIRDDDFLYIRTGDITAVDKSHYIRIGVLPKEKAWIPSTHTEWKDPNKSSLYILHIKEGYVELIYDSVNNRETALEIANKIFDNFGMAVVTKINQL